MNSHDAGDVSIASKKRSQT